MLLGRSSAAPEGFGGAIGLPGPKESNREKLLKALGLSPNSEEVAAAAAVGLESPPKNADILLESFEAAKEPKVPEESRSSLWIVLYGSKALAGLEVPSMLEIWGGPKSKDPVDLLKRVATREVVTSRDA